MDCSKANTQMIVKILINKIDIVYKEIKNKNDRDQAELFALMELIQKYVNDTYLPGFKLSECIFEIVFLAIYGTNLHLICILLHSFVILTIWTGQKYSCVRALTLICESQILQNQNPPYLQKFKDMCEVAVKEEWATCQHCASAMVSLKNIQENLNN